jgi:hypothetical protein
MLFELDPINLETKTIHVKVVTGFTENLMIFKNIGEQLKLIIHKFQHHLIIAALVPT